MSSKRIQEIDALRGLAAIAVLIFHYSNGYQKNYGFIEGQPFDFRFGYLGVHLFFIISGFVIFMTIERTERPRDFVFSRLSRLFPTFWTGVFTTTAIVTFSQLPNTQRTLPEVLVNLTMLQEFIGVRDVEGVYWTLSIEIIFYVLALAIFAFGLLRHTTSLVYAWLTVQLAANVAEHLHGSFPWTIKFYLLTEYCHLFIAGIVFYKIFKNQATRACYGLLVFAAFNQFILFQKDLPATRFEEGLVGLFFFAMMWAVVQGKATFLAIKPLVFLGTISYSLYLTHQFLGYSIIRHFELNGWSTWGGISVATATSLVLASLITRYVEQPSLKWLRNWYRGSGTADSIRPAIAEQESISESHQEDVAVCATSTTRLDSGTPIDRKPTKQERLPSE